MGTETVFMRPNWVSHDAFSIYSIDIHPDGTRFATGGGDNKIKIWNMEPLLSEAKEKDPSIPRLLASLPNHTAPVNCVRFSDDGRYLASASDDKNVIIWQYVPGAGQSFGEEKTVEQWRVLKIFHSHTADVAAVCWSPDNTKIASGGVDKVIRIWDVASGKLVAELTGHESFVKGLAWDPRGVYLASQSDDRSLLIWRTSDWTRAAKLEEPFSKHTTGALFLRGAWSPDGGSFVACGGFKDGVHTAPIIDRSNWSAMIEFVGHRNPIVVARWNPQVFVPDAAEDTSTSSTDTPVSAKKKPASKVYAVCAIGSQDSSLSVWRTSSAKPVLIARDVFEQTVMDLAWSPDGHTLLAASSDGHVCYIGFGRRGALGVALPKEERDRFIAAAVGPQTAVANGGAGLLESAEFITRIPVSMPAAAASTVETEPPPTTPTVPTTTTTSPTTSVPQQRETRTADGRRRITPQFIGGLAAAPPLAAMATAASAATPPPPIAETSASAFTEPTAMDVDLPAKRKAPEAAILIDGDDDSEAAPRPTKRHKPEPVQRKPLTKPAGGTAEKTKHSRGIPVAPSTPPLSASIVPPNIAADGRLQRQLKPRHAGDTPAVLEATPVAEAVQPNLEITQVVCSVGTNQSWHDRVRGKVTAICGNSRFAAVGTEAGEVLVYSSAGRRMWPPLMTGAALSYLECDQKSLLLAVTSQAQLYLWDVQQPKLLLCQSIAPLLVGMGGQGPTTVDRVYVLAVGEDEADVRPGSPAVATTDGAVFVYSYDMGVFVRVVDNAFPLSAFVRHSATSPESGPLAELWQRHAVVPASAPAVGLSAESAAATETTAHIEQQLAASIALRSAAEYRYWMRVYVRRLTADSSSAKLREVCDELLGPPYITDTSVVDKSKLSAGEWSPTVLGISKRQLLKELLLVIATNRSLQRLVVEFKEALAAVGVSDPPATFPPQGPL